MTTKESKINCPHCGGEIDVQHVLAHQLEEDIKKSYNSQLASEKLKFENQAKLLETEKIAFEEKKKRENELFQDRLDAKVKEEKALLEVKLKAKLEQEKGEEFKLLEKELNEKGLLALYRDLELPVADLLAVMERRGIAVDQAALVALQDFFTGEVNRETAQAHSIVGHEFNLASPKQLQVVLFEELKLPKTKRSRLATPPMPNL